MEKSQPKLDLILETSWEVCNKVGGIYTVLSTKARVLQKAYKDKVIFIGPDVWSDENPSPFFKEVKSLLRDWRNQLLLPEGVEVRVGRWEVPGRPIAVLVRFDGMYRLKNDFYAQMWNLFHVDSLHAYGDYDEACAFAHAAALVGESLINFFAPQSTGVIAHFDEWTTGMGLLYTKARLPRVATVFTTHATSIGRSICGNGKPLYDQLHNYNGDQMAEELNMQSKHSLEKAAALNADCFTTVSDITADECAQLLGRRPEVVTYNGFEQDFVPKGRAYAALRNKARKRLLKVAHALTGDIPAEDTFILATSGRSEYRNKGLDLFLDTLDSLRRSNLSRPVLAYIMVPGWTREARPDLAVSIDTDTYGRLTNPVITHSLNNEDSDAILSRIRQLGFWNNTDDKVKVIYAPSYLNGNDGIFDMTYYDLLSGMDATVFASYYEPWGYTPLESVAFGIPTVTTSLSGFGRWVEESGRAGFGKSGVSVVQRNDSDYDQVCALISADITNLDNDPAARLAAISALARETASLADWEHFIILYYQAYDIALHNAEKRLSQRK